MGFDEKFIRTWKFYLKYCQGGFEAKKNNTVEVILGGGYKIDFPDFENIGNIKFISSFEDFDKMLIGLK